MDTKTLVAGQDVYMVSNEIYGCKGKVVEVTTDGVIVQAGGKLIRFDPQGMETEESRRKRLGFEPSPGDTFHNVLWFRAPEFQPWEIEASSWITPQQNY